MRLMPAIIALILLVLVSSSAFIVRENELAALFQFGAIQRVDFKPGLHFKLPLLQVVHKFDRRVLTLESEPERYLTSERKDVKVDFFVKWRINDVSRFYTASNGDWQVTNQRLLPVVRQALGKEINERKLAEVVSSERSNVMDQLLERTNAAVKELGIDIIDVRIKRIELPDEVSESVYNRMSAERKKVANDLRSRGNEAAETIRADADRQRQILLAEADRDANQLRGEGEAGAAQIYAKAYQRDPEFYGFYKSLETYREGLKGRDTILLLDPKSELFQYLGAPK